jgi:hypothetical protein
VKIMAEGNVQNYQGSGNPDIIESGVDKWLKVYNNTSGALTNGYPYNVVVATDAAGVPYYSAITAAANDVVANVVGVVDNSPLGLGTIAAYAYGYVKVRGKVSARVLGASGTVIGDGLEVTAADTDNFQKEAGTTNDGKQAVQCAAILLETWETTSVAAKSVFLLGKLSAIAAT